MGWQALGFESPSGAWPPCGGGRYEQERDMLTAYVCFGTLALLGVIAVGLTVNEVVQTVLDWKHARGQ